MKSAVALEDELRHLIIDALMLEDVTADDIESETPLFNEGVGLDSIDALELGMAISKKYKIKIKQDQEENRQYFANIKSLAEFVCREMQAQEANS